MRRYVEAVTLFHQRQRLGISQPRTVKLEILRRHLIHEELSELELAWYRVNLEGVMDAVGDLLYVTAGSAVQFGHILPAMIPGRYLVGKDLGEHSVLEFSKNLATRLSFEMDCMMVEEMVGHTIAFARRMDLPYDEIFDRVQAANMTKTPRSEGDERVSDKGTTFVPPRYDDLVAIWRGA